MNPSGTLGTFSEIKVCDLRYACVVERVSMNEVGSGSDRVVVPVGVRVVRVL